MVVKGSGGLYCAGWDIGEGLGSGQTGKQDDHMVDELHIGSLDASVKRIEGKLERYRNECRDVTSGGDDGVISLGRNERLFISHEGNVSPDSGNCITCLLTLRLELV